MDRRPRPRSPLRDVGQAPDARFTLANERTFLAWIRTALALDAAGLGVLQFLPPFAVPYAREGLGVALLVLGTAVAFVSYRRWEHNERALREHRSFPPSRAPLALAVGVGLVGVAILGVLLVDV